MEVCSHVDQYQQFRNVMDVMGERGKERGKGVLTFSRLKPIQFSMTAAYRASLGEIISWTGSKTLP